jgi:prostaglandin-endoperoxide synthase 2
LPEYVTDYTSWPSLTNREFSARHLAPAPPSYIAGLPPDTPFDAATNKTGDVTSLFMRRGPMTTSRSSMLFMFFAQWFTDSVLRFNPLDRRKNTSNHDIDLCQIYGLTEDAARLLRKHDDSGQLRCQSIHGEEYPEYLCGKVDGEFKVLPHFEALRAAGNFTADDVVDKALGPTFKDRKGKLYATGLERGNSSIGYVAISTIFMREHNRLASKLKNENKTWSGERIFQTARNINIVLLLKLVVEDYINHIIGHRLFRLDPTFAEREEWYRPNWIAAEFDLLYRWHGLAPDVMTVAGKQTPANLFRNNNALLEEAGVGNLIDAASRQRAGKVGLANTPEYLWEAEWLAIKMGRDFRLRSFNEYRERFGLKRLRDFSQLTPDRALQDKLEKLYGNIDNLEFVVGLFAEEPDAGDLFGDLLSQMVAYDAFTQIFSNPLLARGIYSPATFTDYGMKTIEETTSIEVLVNRNVLNPVRASLSVLPGA